MMPRKTYLPRVVRKIAIAAVCLIILIFAAGAAYVYYSGRNYQDKAKPVATKTSPPLFVKPVKPGKNNPEGVAVESLTSPVKAGENASIYVSTNAGSDCNIIVEYSGVKSTDSGLAPKKADEYGTAQWTWTVATSTPAGTWPVKVTCVYNGKTGLVIGNQEVTKV